MGWDVASKSVIRLNDDYTGANVWSQDRVAGIKVIATRHDTHDQDLADSISACLNLDGINEMRANLSVGAFKITNLAKGTAVNDAARFGQTVTAMSFDDPTRTLTLTRADEAALQVVISGGTGGGGSVTSVTIGEGLDGTTNPITVSGDIKLATIGTLQTFSGGIGSITVDKHGRVTQVIESGAANTNLDIANRIATTLDITSSTGTDVTVPAATSTLSGLMTAADKLKLDGGNATIITGLTALASGLVSTDELMVSDAGTLKRMDVSVMNAYFNANLSFAASSHTHAAADVTSGVFTAGQIPSLDASKITTGTFADAFLATITTANKVSGLAVNIAGISTMSTDATNDELLCYDASLAANRSITLSNIKSIGGVSGQRVTISASAPGTPSTNDIWIDVS